MLMRTTPLMRKHLAMAAGRAALRSPLPTPAVHEAFPHRGVRLVAWPQDEAPGVTAMPPWKRLVQQRPQPAPADEPPRCVARLVAAPEGVRILPHPPEPTLTRQLRATCTAIGCSLPELTGPAKMRPLAVARAELYWLGVAYFGLSLPQIGRVMGGRDHTTVLNGKRRAVAAFRAAGLASTEAALQLSPEQRREIILAHFIAVAGRAFEDQRGVPA